MIRCILVLIYALTLSAQQRYVPGQLVPGIGVRQRNLSAADLKLRERGIVDSLKFRVATNPAVIEGAERMLSPKIQAALTNAARKYSFPKEWLEAIAFLESNGTTDAVSPTGPKGLFQISAAAGFDEGIVKYGKVQKTKTVGRGKKKRVVKYWTKGVTEDHRTEPEAAAEAAARHLLKRQAVYGGRLDWAVESYHSGGQPIKEWTRAYAKDLKLPGIKAGSLTEVEGGGLLASQNVSVAGMFFAGSPVWNTKLYDSMESYMTAKKDYSPTYLFRVQAAMDLLNWYRRDKRGFTKYAQENWNKYKPGQPARSRMYAWFTREDFFLKTLGDLEEASVTRNGTYVLYRVPDEPRLLGYFLRLTGLHPIGEADMKHQDSYRYLRPAGIGLVAYVAYEYKGLCEEYRADHPKSKPCSDLEVVALSRTLAYQQGLKKKVQAAKTGWPTHTTAWVFDLSLKNMPDYQAECLWYVLQSLEWMGKLSFVDESNLTPTYHTLPSPESRQFFAARFEEVKKLVGDKGSPSQQVIPAPPVKAAPPVITASKKEEKKKEQPKITAQAPIPAAPKPPAEEPTTVEQATEQEAPAEAPAGKPWRVPAPAPKQGPIIWTIPAPTKK